VSHRVKKSQSRRRVSARADRLRSEIAQLEARYDSGAMPPSIYMVPARLRAELARRSAARE
jgi:hypothetical protein